MANARGLPAFTRKGSGPVVIPPRRQDETIVVLPPAVPVTRGGRHSTGKRRGTLYRLAAMQTTDDTSRKPAVSDSRLLNSGEADRERLGVSDSEMDERAHRRYIVDSKVNNDPAKKERTSDPETTNMEAMRRFPTARAATRRLADFWTYSTSMEFRWYEAAEVFLQQQKSCSDVKAVDVNIVSGVEAFIQQSDEDYLDIL
eukprot:Lankesteria_metandrocarpae@DN10752_c0_g1_i1.p1